MTKLFVTSFRERPSSAILFNTSSKRLASKVSNLHHLVLCLICQIFNRIDAGTFQAVIRAHRQIQFFQCSFPELFPFLPSSFSTMIEVSFALSDRSMNRFRCSFRIFAPKLTASSGAIVPFVQTSRDSLS